jgi:hypothetical protein
MRIVLSCMHVHVLLKPLLMHAFIHRPLCRLADFVAGVAAHAQPDMGGRRALVATRAFAAGARVLFERPLHTFAHPIDLVSQSRSVGSASSSSTSGGGGASTSGSSRDGGGSFDSGSMARQREALFGAFECHDADAFADAARVHPSCAARMLDTVSALRQRAARDKIALSESDVHRLASLCCLHAHSLALENVEDDDNNSGSGVRHHRSALFPLGALALHSCLPNCAVSVVCASSKDDKGDDSNRDNDNHSDSSDGRIALCLMALRPISAGERITVARVALDEPAHERRRRLLVVANAGTCGRHESQRI